MHENKIETKKYIITSFDDIPLEIKREILDYIFKDINLKSKKIKELQYILDLKYINKEFYNLIYCMQNKIKKIIKIKKEELGLQLLDASRLNKYHEVKKLIEEDAEINMIEKEGIDNTALIYACFNNNLEMVKLLIQAGANLNLENKNGITPLIESAHNGNIDIVKLLIKSKVNINLKNKQREWTALHWACIWGSSDNIQVKIHKNTQTRSIIKEIIVLLIQNGADINIRSDDGHTALDFASGEIKEIILKLKEKQKNN